MCNNIEEYLKSIKKELEQLDCEIDSIDTNSVTLEIAIYTRTATKMQLNDVFEKYNFCLWEIGNDYYIYGRNISNILNEIRVNALKELLK